jgi:hypothetical protein
MTCADYRDDLLDVARGRADSVAAAGAVAHRDHCEACRRWFAEQRTLTEALRALARTAETARPSADLEERLLGRFDAEHAGLVDGSECRGDGRRARAVVAWTPRWLPLAAAVALAAAGSIWWLARPDRPASPVLAPRVMATTSPGVATATPARTAVTPTNRVESPTASEVVRAGAPAAAPGAARARGPRATPPEAAPRIVEAEGFIALPSAGALPPFERGEIVRTELPWAALPAYGLGIPPGAEAGAVQIDFLIAQDGRPRAVRLVANELNVSRSRR